MTVSKGVSQTTALKNAISNVDMYKNYIADQKAKVADNEASLQQ